MIHHLFVGGARSNVVTISDVFANCAFISSPDIFLISSTINFRFLFDFVIPLLYVEASIGVKAKLSLSLFIEVGNSSRSSALSC